MNPKVEPKAVLDTCKRLEKYGYRVTYMPVQKDGLVDLDDLKRAMDDIWPSFYVQAKGFKVAYNRASVYQERNPHDLTANMQDEYVGYSNNLKLVMDLSRDPQSIAAYMPGRTAWAFHLYRKHFES